MNEAWLFLKDFGIVLNYLLVPIAAGIWKIGGYVMRMEKRITYLEILHRIKGCHREMDFDLNETEE